MSHALTILSTAIRTDAEGRYCLNDCWRAAGARKTDAPNKWLDTAQAQELVAEMEKEVTPKMGSPLNTVMSGPNSGRGTYAVKELVYAYAMWINPTFHLAVIRAFDSMVTGQLPPSAPETPAQLMARALLQADQTMKAQQAQLAVALPKAEAFDELADATGFHNLRTSAQLCGWPEKLFIQRLVELGWIYAHPVTGRKCAYAAKIKAGYMSTKEVPIFHRSGETEYVGQPLVTQKGLTRLSMVLGAYSSNGNTKLIQKGELQ